MDGFVWCAWHRGSYLQEIPESQLDSLAAWLPCTRSTIDRNPCAIHSHAGEMVLAVALRCLGNDACSFQPRCLAKNSDRYLSKT